MIKYSNLNTKRQIRKESVSIAVTITLILLAIFSGMPLIETALSDQHLALLPSPSPSTRQPPSRFHSGKGIAKGKFLVASRQIKDPRFSETVVLLTKYNRRGAIGLVINRPTDLRLSKVLPDIKGLQKRKDILYFGGPVAINQKQLLIRTNSKPEGSHHVFNNVYVIPNLSIIKRMIDGVGVGERLRVYAGYAGWASGQLEREVSRGGWHVLRADAETIFDKVSSEIWPELISRFDINNLTI